MTGRRNAGFVIDEGGMGQHLLVIYRIAYAQRIVFFFFCFQNMKDAANSEKAVFICIAESQSQSEL